MVKFHLVLLLLMYLWQLTVGGKKNTGQINSSQLSHTARGRRRQHTCSRSLSSLPPRQIHKVDPFSANAAFCDNLQAPAPTCLPALTGKSAASHSPRKRVEMKWFKCIFIRLMDLEKTDRISAIFVVLLLGLRKGYHMCNPAKLTLHLCILVDY